MMNTNDLDNIIYMSRIDTLETKEPYSNRIDDINDIKGIEKHYDKNNNIITKYNPNNFSYQYSTDYNLTKTIDTLEEMTNVLTVIDPNKIEYRRIDIATDISKKFIDISKFLDLTHKCLRAKEKDGKAWHNISDNDLRTSNYLYRNKYKMEIEFYDKDKESNGKANYPTRMEVRFLRISSKDLKLHIDNTIKLWNSMPSNLQQVEKEMIEILKNKFIEDKQAKKIANFTEFVCKYQEYIYTQRILKELYIFSGLNGSYKPWLQKYRNNHNIEFYTISHLKTFSKNIIKSLKEYKKS